MVRLATYGAEANSASVEGFSLGGTTPSTISTSVVRSGSYAISCAPAAGSNTSALTAASIVGTTGTTYYARAYIRYSTLPTAANTPALSLYTGGIPIASVSVSSANAVRVFTGNQATQIGSDGATLTTGVWYRFELSININAGAGADDTVEGRLDGTTIGSSATATIGTAAPTIFQAGFPVAPGNVALCYVDDVGWNDSTGTAQNTWLGAGKVVFLLPTADSAVGTGWTLGTGTAISGNSGSTAVKNTPPLGVADLAAGSDVKQIRNASSNANVNYDATMTTYSAAGLNSGDTVNVVVPIVATAAPVTTSAKAGTVGVVSNPAITNIALGAGGTAGAFWSGTAGGTYATGWKISYGTTTYAPSVTVGTAPVMRVTQVTSSTRIAVVCFMGMQVDYTPAVAGSLPINPRPVLQAVNRSTY